MILTSIDLCILCFVCFFFVPPKFYARRKMMVLNGVLVYVCALFVLEVYVFLVLGKLLSVRQLIRVYILLIGGGAVVFYLLYMADKDRFSGSIHEGHELGDFVYFAVITGSTTGYGDIIPSTILSRRIVSCFVMLCMAINIFIISTTIQKVVSSTGDEVPRVVESRYGKRKKGEKRFDAPRPGV